MSSTKQIPVTSPAFTGAGEARRVESASVNAPAVPARWSAMRKQTVVLRLLRGESLDQVSREVGVPIFKLELWQKRALSGLASGLKEREGDPLHQQHQDALKRVGELSMENELLRSKIQTLENGRPFAVRRRSKK